MARYAREDDFEFAKKSWKICFDDSAEFVEWNFAHNYLPSNTIIDEYGGDKASIMQLMPYSLSIGGQNIDMRYISGVATLPEYRGRGLVRDMFKFALPELYNMGCGISILVPAVNGMYEKFGYRKICGRISYTADVLPDTEMITRYDDGLIPRLDRMYCDEMSNKAVYIKRSDWDWERILTDLICISKGVVLIFRIDGADVGYALAYPKDSWFDVPEICGKVELSNKVCDSPPIMARIINAQDMLRRFADVFKDLGTIDIRDDLIPENNFRFDCGSNTACMISVSEATEILFSKMLSGDDKRAYINLLL